MLRNLPVILIVVGVVESAAKPRRRLVIVLIAFACAAVLLGGPCMPRKLARMFQSKRVRAELDLVAISDAIGARLLDLGQNPTTGAALLQTLRQGPPLPLDPDLLTEGRFLDPWGNEYVLRSSPNSVEITSYGSDGQAGGEGDAADLIRTVQARLR